MRRNHRRACNGLLAVVLTAQAARASAAPEARAPSDMVDGRAERASSARALQLRSEIEQLEDEREGISQAGPAVALVVGYIFAPLILVGPPFLMIDSESCSGCESLGAWFTGLGAVGLGVGAWGLVKAIANSDRRVNIDQKLRSRQQELNSLSWDVKVGPGNAYLSATF